jgi:hypothetical protein
VQPVATPPAPPAAKPAVDDTSSGQRFDALVVPVPAASKNSRVAPSKKGVRGPRSALRAPAHQGAAI